MNCDRLILIMIKKQTDLSEWIKWTFEKYSNGNNSLTRHQMKLAVITLTGHKPNLPKDHSKFSLEDLNEFIGTSGTILCNTSIIYDQIDVEQKGFITLKDLLDANKKSESKIQESVLKSAFSRADIDHDGRIPFSEFLSIVSDGLTDLGFSKP